MKTTKQILFITFLGVFMLMTTQRIKAQIVTNITTDSAHTLTQYYSQNPNFVILDVRTAGEYNAGHIAKAANIDFYSTAFYSMLDSMDKNKIYLIHCASGGRSGVTRDSMAAKNFQTVFNMIGGYNTWVLSYPVTQLTNPVLSILGNDSLHYGYVEVGKSKTFTVKLTNSANDTLKFTGFTLPSNPSFSSNFSISNPLLGYEDYKFQVSYSPNNYSFDTSAMVIQSNGGSLTIYFDANSGTMGIKTVSAENRINAFPNPATNFIYINGNMELSKPFMLINAEGKILKTIYLNKETHKLNISYLPVGVYLLRNSKQSIRFIKK